MKWELGQFALRVWVAVGTKMQHAARDDEGQGLVEYGLIIGLVAVVLVAALVTLTGGLKGIFGTITNALTPPSTGG
ncbi:MAG: Flp family type IVb pilin [Firmicutes bacterium]|nr:Flp family type IVb pilin [Bacillota bacterium]